ncbi:MAG: inositol monophosphatase [Actinobacteria bacterium]|nr:inositol monophosphatase [Actinomycetota bacterium]
MIAPAWRPETALAIKAGRRALKLAGSGRGAGDVRIKGTRDLVTDTDITVEDTLRGILSQLPRSTVVGEERGGEPPGDGSPYWLVDPICGTANFASGIPLYCVNLALVEDGQVTVAVVGDASTGSIHVAEQGGGAWALGDGPAQQLTVSEQSRIIVIEDGRCHGRRRERAARGTAAAIRADKWDLRALSTTLSLPYVAASRVAGYLAFRAPALHTAAGSLLAAEAGATVSDIDAHPWTTSSDSIIAAANPSLHRELLAIAQAPMI